MIRSTDPKSYIKGEVTKGRKKLWGSGHIHYLDCSDKWNLSTITQ